MIIDMTMGGEKDFLYEQEEMRPEIRDGQYCVAVRDNDEARLMIGAELGKEYTTDQIRTRTTRRYWEAKKYGSTYPERYRILSCEYRLFNHEKRDF